MTDEARRQVRKAGPQKLQRDDHGDDDRAKRSQRGKFIHKARELGCDEDPTRFEETLRRIARAKPKREPPPAGKPSQPKAGSRKPPR